MTGKPSGVDVFQVHHSAPLIRIANRTTLHRQQRETPRVFVSQLGRLEELSSDNTALPCFLLPNNGSAATKNFSACATTDKKLR